MCGKILFFYLLKLIGVNNINITVVITVNYVNVLCGYNYFLDNNKQTFFNWANYIIESRYIILLENNMTKTQNN